MRKMAVDGQRFMTKTQHYRKITKPLLERKRRARMNLYLDELKSLIVDTMGSQGEHANKLEKADILEMTVNYLKLHKHKFADSAQNTAGPHELNLEKFRAGYTHAAYEVSKLFATLPGLDLKFGTRLLKQLGYNLKMDKQRTFNVNGALAEYKQLSESMSKDFSISKSELHYSKHSASAPAEAALHAEIQPKVDDVWRPW